MNTSWDTTKRTKPCLCGKGKLVQETRMDDWNRIEENTPYFECEECRNKYNIESKFFNPKPAHEYTIYYAVDKVTGEKKQLDI